MDTTPGGCAREAAPPLVVPSSGRRRPSNLIGGGDEVEDAPDGVFWALKACGEGGGGNPSMILTASGDEVVRVWDLRWVVHTLLM